MNHPLKQKWKSVATFAAGVLVGGAVVWTLSTARVIAPYSVTVAAPPVSQSVATPQGGMQMLTVPLGGPSSVTVQVPRSMF